MVSISGEEDQTLAGLVPSQSFQHQRESMRLAAEERMSKPQRKSSTLLCGKTPKRKKKKGTFTDAGYPIYANAVDGKNPLCDFENRTAHHRRRVCRVRTGGDTDLRGGRAVLSTGEQQEAHCANRAPEHRTA